MLGQAFKVTSVVAMLVVAGEFLLSPAPSCWAAHVLVQRDAGSPDTAQLLLFSPGGGLGLMMRRFAESPAHQHQPGSACRATLLRAASPR